MQQDDGRSAVNCEWPNETASEKDRELQLWRQQVSAIPSVFGRLAFLAGLKNPATGRYTHYRLKVVLGDDAADLAIRRTHLDVFAEWPSFHLEEQQNDLNVFFAGVEGHRRQILAACAVSAPHVWCIPDGAAEHERRLYLADLQAILEPLYSQYGLSAASAPDPDANPLTLPGWDPQ